MQATVAGPNHVEHLDPLQSHQQLLVEMSGGPVTVGFRPEDARLLIAPGRNAIRARVLARHYVGDAHLYQLDAGGVKIQVRGAKQPAFETGTELHVDVDPACCILFNTSEGTSP